MCQPDGEQMSIYDAAMKYVAAGTPTMVFGGEEYGTGSSRDWAAKGTQLLGVKAVITRSFERIHRSNLVGMGVLPLQFIGDDSVQSLLLFEAIARAADKGTLKKGGVAEEMRKTDSMTLIGRVQFDPKGDNKNFTQRMGQHQGKQVVLVWPKEAATGKAVYPGLPW